MQNKNFYDRYESLPIEAKRQVLAYIDFLKEKYQTKSNRLEPKKSLRDKKFVGLWSDREELSDSAQWVRNIRKREWKEIG